MRTPSASSLQGDEKWRRLGVFGVASKQLEGLACLGRAVQGSG